MHRNISDRQRGVALAVSLVMLLLLSLIGLFVSRTSSLELRMAGNVAAKAVSFEHAEDARLDAEKLLISIAYGIDTGTAYDCGTLGTGYYAGGGAGSNCSSMDVAALAWNGSDSLVNSENSHARYAVEYRGVNEVDEPYNDLQLGHQSFRSVDFHVFRIAGHGTEASGATSIISTVFLVRKSI
jgi:type IV pilus assembly protein PilX